MVFKTIESSRKVKDLCERCQRCQVELAASVTGQSRNSRKRHRP